MAASALDVAKVAKTCATQKSTQEYRMLSSLMCWDAVLHVAMLAGVIPDRRYQTLKGKPQTLVNTNDPAVTDAAGMKAVPAGHAIGFFEDDGGTPKIIHCMVSTGSGKAAGNKNDCVGVGSMVGWEELDLAAGLSWSGSGIQAPKGEGVTRAVTVHHRPITRLA